MNQPMAETISPHGLRAPHVPEAETAVLGMLMSNNELHTELEAPLHAEDFYAKRNQVIFSHLACLLIEQGQAADVVTLASSLANADQLDYVGGTEYLKDLHDYGETSLNFREYVSILREMRSLRRLIEEIDNILANVREPRKMGALAILEYAESRVFELVSDFKNLRSSSMLHVSEVTERVEKQIQDLIARIKAGKLPYTGVVTGYGKVDRLTLGLQPGELVILAARPSVGKTSLALDFVRNMCRRPDEEGRARAVIFFSLEMSSGQLANRLLSCESGISLYNLRTAQISDKADWQKFVRAREELGKWQLWIDDTTLLDVNVIRSQARRTMREAEQRGAVLSMIVIDYLQLLTGTSDQAWENRNLEITGISRNLKSLARELNVPVLALSQLSRKSISREDKRPILSDLRDSGSLEQDADLIMMLHRESSQNGVKIPVKLIINKNRNGPIGDCGLIFDAKTTHFEEDPDMEDTMREDSGSGYGDIEDHIPYSS